HESGPREAPRPHPAARPIRPVADPVPRQVEAAPHAHLPQADRARERTRHQPVTAPLAAVRRLGHSHHRARLHTPTPPAVRPVLRSCTRECTISPMSARNRASTEDPRVVRTRAAVVAAARDLFLRKGHAGTTMEEIATVAGIAKRTVYNNYADKDALFREIVGDAIAYAETFAHELPGQLASDLDAEDLPAALHDLGARMAHAILRPEIVALRRLLIGEARAFPELARAYFDRAPGRVIDALAAAFGTLADSAVLDVPDVRRAAEQFAYLVVGAPLDRAMLVGEAPGAAERAACAREGVETFLARYGRAPG